MTWWSWILIWTGLSLALVAMVALFAYSYVRKGLGILRQLDALMEKMGAIADDEQAEPLARTRPAILIDRDTLLETRRLHQDRRAERLAVRRGIRLQRGKLLVHRNPIT